MIAANQDLINDPSGGDKGLTGEVVLEETIALFQNDTDLDPRTVDPNSRMGRLFQAQMAAIKEVVDEQQGTINRPGVGFKGFVPAVFGRLVNERFKEKVGDEAQIKVTAPVGAGAQPRRASGCLGDRAHRGRAARPGMAARPGLQPP